MYLDMTGWETGTEQFHDIFFSIRRTNFHRIRQFSLRLTQVDDGFISRCGEATNIVNLIDRGTYRRMDDC